MSTDNSWSGDIDRTGFKDIETINTISGAEESGDSARLTESGNTGQYTSEMETELSLEKKEEKPVSVFDAASYILKKLNCSISTMKLHKLLYYSQAWSMVWDGKPLFKDKIEAWANGPVVRTLFSFHRGMYDISYFKLGIGDERNLSEEQKETIDGVLKFYGDMTAQALINQTHFEDPWRNARVGLNPDEPGDHEISLESLQAYYSSLK